MSIEMRSVQEIEEAIAELRRRWPAHSLTPTMLGQLEELEVELERAQKVEDVTDA